jgi:hypothetical protein
VMSLTGALFKHHVNERGCQDCLGKHPREGEILQEIIGGKGQECQLRWVEAGEGCNHIAESATLARQQLSGDLTTA